MTYRPIYIGPFEPKFPCREMPTRHCPAIYGEVCGDRACGRYGPITDKQAREIWLPEIEIRK